ncbi:hypothetical protein I302_105363 [Kwoniella bestiolae CBS 10118]|uniref:Arrestin-like N-terminal domain-containing protein n=1 Tax=Kwoniella bestiolae CBS 10118 TaxID=1296100 RepID=A0A1B9FSX7_9TREE|nr:hypothetical protein I302_08647 [Kwoniella bestiolae CBS 10118]OCF21868.1 hypothetical protein I302_08647 [Kwoniella bestiolae CBS 10118]
MIRLDVQLYQSPIYLPPCTSTQDDIALSGCVRITSSTTGKIPGLEVLLVNTIEHRSEVGGKWSACELNEAFTTTVLEGDHWVQTGTTDFEFSLRIKRTVPYTRTTHFDRVNHTLYAIVPNGPPGYDRYRPSSRNTSRSNLLKRSLLPRSRNKNEPHTVFHPISRAPVLAIAAEPVHVYGPKSYLDQVNTSSWSERTQISSIGVNVSLRSEEEYAALGSAYSVELKISNLPPTLTLHGWNIVLHQVTQNERGAVFRDVYTIGAENEATSLLRLPGRSCPRSQDEYLWRGPGAPLKNGDSPSSSTGSTFTRALSTRLPSPVIGGLPSCHDGSTYASIHHSISLVLHYSILGEDIGGDPLPDPTTEGSIRSWVYERPIHILSDLHGLGEVPTPAYSPKEVGTLPETKVQDLDVGMDLVQRLNLSHMVSMSKSKTGFMRPSVLRADTLGSRIQEHWSRTGGLCACFDEAEERGNKCIRMESVEGSEAIKLS